MRRDILQALDGKWEDGTRPKDLFAEYVARDPAAYVAPIVAGLSSEKRRVKNGCAELASLVSSVQPSLLAPHVGLFVKNLDATEAVLRWEAACTLGNLAGVDGKGKVLAVLGKLIDLLDHESIVLQGHAVRALAKVAGAFPASAPRVLAALTGADLAFAGTRVGYLVEAMEAFAALPALAPKARAFAAQYVESEHRPVASKAKRALKKLDRGAASARGGDGPRARSATRAGRVLHRGSRHMSQTGGASAAIRSSSVTPKPCRS